MSFIASSDKTTWPPSVVVPLIVKFFVIVALSAFKLLVLVVDAVIFVANKLVKNPDIAVNIFENKLLVVAFVIDAFSALSVVILAFVIVALPNIGLLVKMYVTFPSVEVATVRLELVDDARNVYSLAIDVVETTPFTTDVIIPEEAVILLVFIIAAVEVTPFTTEVNKLVTLVKSF